MPATKARKPKAPAALPVRGYLLHITHYDPAWLARKDHEEPFGLDVGLAVIDAMADAGLNLLVIDPKDGVRYASHPELARPYTRPLEVLAKLRERATKRGIEVAIKLNFSQSALHQHNHWFRPHNDLFDQPEYWRLGFEVIDELLGVLQPPRFFHVGMDEDHARSYRQYVAAIKTLRDGLVARKLRPLIWNDSACTWPAAEIHKDKSLAAEREGSKDIIHVLWDYWSPDPSPPLRRLRDAGFDVWGAPGGKPELVSAMRDALLKVGGGGILLTQWCPCVPVNRGKMIEFIRTCGPLCGG